MPLGALNSKEKNNVIDTLYSIVPDNYFLYEGNNYLVFFLAKEISKILVLDYDLVLDFVFVLVKGENYV